MGDYYTDERLKHYREDPLGAKAVTGTCPHNYFTEDELFDGHQIPDGVECVVNHPKHYTDIVNNLLDKCIDKLRSMSINDIDKFLKS